MKQGLSLRVSQHLALTPQLQQSIRLLQLSTLELNQEIEDMLDDNPFLERDLEEGLGEDLGLQQADAPAAVERDAEDEWTPSSDVPGDGLYEVRVESSVSDTTPEASDVAESWDGDGSLEMSPDDSEWGGDAPARQAGDDDDLRASDLRGQHVSLAEHLHQQAMTLRLSEEDSAALRFLIESLDEDGYLTDSLEELAQGLAGDDLEAQEELVQRFEMARHLLHHLEPAGVGAADLAECLRLQLKALPDDESLAEVREVALALVAQPLALLAKRDVKKMAQAVAASEALVKAAMALIARLEPKPGRRFVDVQGQEVVPDVIVSRAGVDRTGLMRFRVQLNPDVMPKLRVNDYYANALKGAGKSESALGLQQRLQEARWMIKNIQQRFDTILRVSEAILQRQRSFFVHGELAMKPMVLREIADELGMHESTISRVTTAKYMATPMGTFELKYFFGSGLGTESGHSASSTAVRALIKQFIASENPKKPLSDNQIADMLKEQGIDCARRTVAKYREAMRIAPTQLRKVL